MTAYLFSRKNLLVTADLVSSIAHVPLTIIDTGSTRCASSGDRSADDSNQIAMFDICQSHLRALQQSGVMKVFDCLITRRGDTPFDCLAKRFLWLKTVYLVPVRAEDDAQEVRAWLCLLSDSDTALSAEQKQSITFCASLLASTFGSTHALVDETVIESNKMLSAVSQALAEYIRSKTSTNPFDVMLSHLLKMSHSEYGFIGEILHAEESGDPYLKTHAITNIAWNEPTTKFFDDNVAAGLTFSNLNSLFGHVMTTGKPVIANLPAKDPRRDGLPAGHPALNAFMGLPIYSGVELIGMVGIANRPNGYDQSVAMNLELLLTTCSNLILAFRAESGRYLAQQQLVSSEEMFRALVDSAADGIFQISENGLIEWANRSMEAMFSLTSKQLIGMPAANLFDSKNLSELQNMLGPESASDSRACGARKEFSAVRGNIELFDVEITINAMQQGERRHFVAIMRDISAWKKIREELLEAKVQAESGNKAKGEFLANMSHEVRTPLNGVIGMTELALGTKLNAEQREYLEIIRESGLTLLRVINDILDFSRIGAGQLAIECVPFDIRQSLAVIMREFTLRAEQKGLDFVYQIEAGIPAILIGDPLRLRQVLVNLISNAIKFTESGQIAVDIKQKYRTACSGIVEFVIKDTGIGITPKQQAAIFTAFAQADTSITRKFGGSGLGLMISSNLLRLMGGEIHVSSKLGRGSTFSFQLSFQIGDADLSGVVLEHKINDDTMPIVEERRGKPPALKVLVAEDNLVNQKLMRMMLTKAGHEVFLASNGIEAVALYNAVTFDLILMDLQMPEMDGVQASTLIRLLESQSGSRTPIVAVTAHAMVGDKDMCLANGMDAYISKPVSASALSKLVASVAGELPPKTRKQP